MQRHESYGCPHGGCPVEASLELIGGKWKGLLLYHLMGKTRRFNELRRLNPEITQRMLTKQLRELEQAGLVSRTVFAEVPPHVEYALTGLGQSLEPVIRALKEWETRYMTQGGDKSTCGGSE